MTESIITAVLPSLLVGVAMAFFNRGVGLYVRDAMKTILK